MKKSTLQDQESIATELIEDIKQLKRIALGEGAMTCQACGASLHAGSPVVVAVFRPAGTPSYQLGQIRCGEGHHTLPPADTLGVRELIVEGRIGTCSDVATQSSWPVLLAPTVIAVSEASTTATRPVPPTTPSTTRSPTTGSGSAPDRDADTDGNADILPTSRATQGRTHITPPTVTQRPTGGAGHQ